MCYLLKQSAKAFKGRKDRKTVPLLGTIVDYQKAVEAEAQKSQHQSP